VRVICRRIGRLLQVCCAGGRSSGEGHMDFSSCGGFTLCSGMLTVAVGGCAGIWVGGFPSLHVRQLLTTVEGREPDCLLGKPAELPAESLFRTAARRRVRSLLPRCWPARAGNARGARWPGGSRGRTTAFLAGSLHPLEALAGSLHPLEALRRSCWASKEQGGLELQACVGISKT
jgi:hypothetical protein